MDSENLILLIEDSDEDYSVFLRAIRGIQFKYHILRCSKGVEALDYLFQRGAFAAPDASPRPALILLDLNLPDIKGQQILEQVKKDLILKLIPIIIVTTSNNPQDIEDCYAKGANSFQVKLLNFENFKRGMHVLMDYWFGVAALPPRKAVS